MRDFARAENLTWGGSWKIGGRYSAVHPKTGEKISAGAGELHHFELSRSEYVQNIPAPIKAFMEYIGIPISKIESSDSRNSLYKKMKEIIENRGSLPNSPVTTGNASTAQSSPPNIPESEPPATSRPSQTLTPSPSSTTPQASQTPSSGTQSESSAPSSNAGGEGGQLTLADLARAINFQPTKY
jgi:hypothetical protein